MKAPKIGRPPIGEKAMTSAERQARRRERQREAMAERVRRAQRDGVSERPFQPPYGYQAAKQKLQARGHVFVRVPEEFGREFGGVFVDGAYVTSREVIALAEVAIPECERRLAEARRRHKDIACDAVHEYMEKLRVTRDELVSYLDSYLGRPQRS